jgi:hypothetical protein
MEARKDAINQPESPKPETSVIVFGTDEEPMNDVFPKQSFRFWLMSPTGKSTAFMTEEADVFYHPQNEACKKDADDEEGYEFCGKKPSELARRCMRSSYEVQQSILADPPKEWLDFKAKYGELEFEGWINDYEALGNASAQSEQKSWFGPFNWQGDGHKMGDPEFTPKGTIQWASAIYHDGTCTTPSRDLFIRLVMMMDHCAVAPGPGCCGKTIPNDPNGC